MKRRATRLGVLVACLALVVSGCGGRDDDDDSSASGPGITEEPCPNAVDEEKGCIYLGVITDLTGVFAGVGVPFTEGQKAFWKSVNAAGGIGDYEVDVETHIKDSTYDPQKHAAAFNEIKDDVAFLAQSLGTAQTNAILNDAIDEDILISPASLGSDWIFQDIAVEAGTSYCAEAMNIVDYAVDEGSAGSLAAVYFPTDYGLDAMVGARHAAEQRDIDFTDISTTPVDGGDDQSAAVGALLEENPDYVLLATGPKEMAAIVGGALAQGFEGKFIGSIPSWNSAVLDSPAGPAIQAAYMQASSFPTWESDAPGAQALREAVGDATPNDWFFIGWAGSYITKAILEAAVDNDDLSREGLVEAATSLESVDGEGMLPDGSGNYAGDANDAAVRVTQLNAVDPEAASKVSLAVEPFTGPTAEAYDFTEACYLME